MFKWVQYLLGIKCMDTLQPVEEEQFDQGKKGPTCTKMDKPKYGLYTDDDNYTIKNL